MTWQYLCEVEGLRVDDIVARAAWRGISSGPDLTHGTCGILANPGSFIKEARNTHTTGNTTEYPHRVYNVF